MCSPSVSLTKKTSIMAPFLRKLVIGCGGEPFLDGFVLCIIGVALVQLRPYFHLDAFWSGLIGSVSLAGLFVGGPLFGYITDLTGRKLLYRNTPILLAIISLCQIFVSTPLELLVLRFMIGLVVGADYPITTSVLTEFCPDKHRGVMLGSAMVMWFVGATAANYAGYLFYDVPNGWQWMLGSAVIPAILLAFVRGSMTESPRWLASKGRLEEARLIMKKIYGAEADIADLGQSTQKTQYSKLFGKQYLTRTLFSGLYWACQILPMYALYTFGPEILEALHIGQGKQALLGDSIISLVFLIGCALAAWRVDKLGRRPLIIWSFAVMTLGMLVLGLFSNGPVWVIMAGFLVYALASGGPNALDWIYPNELFPTEIRASGTGMATAISQTGAFLGTFALPYWMSEYGVQVTMLAMTVVTFAGLLVSIAWAPETKGLTLSQAASVSKNHKLSI